MWLENYGYQLKGVTLKYLPMAHIPLPYLDIILKQQIREGHRKDRSIFCSKYKRCLQLFVKMASSSFSSQPLAVLCSAISSMGRQPPFCSFPQSCVVFCVFQLKMSAMDTSMAFKTWEMSNSIETVNSVDEIFKYDRQQQQEILQAKPWQKE